MKQACQGLSLSIKKTREREFLRQLNMVAPRDELVSMVEPHWSKSKRDRPPFAFETMLLIHYLQRWLGLNDLATKDAQYDLAVYRESGMRDESTILRTGHLLVKHGLATNMLRVVNDLLVNKRLLLTTGTAIAATLISTPWSRFSQAAGHSRSYGKWACFTPKTLAGRRPNAKLVIRHAQTRTLSFVQIFPNFE